jgi:hypothetical protein
MQLTHLLLPLLPLLALTTTAYSAAIPSPLPSLSTTSTLHERDWWNPVITDVLAHITHWGSTYCGTIKPPLKKPIMSVRSVAVEDISEEQMGHLEGRQVPVGRPPKVSDFLINVKKFGPVVCGKLKPKVESLA